VREAPQTGCRYHDRELGTDSEGRKKSKSSTRGAHISKNQTGIRKFNQLPRKKKIGRNPQGGPYKGTTSTTTRDLVEGAGVPQADIGRRDGRRLGRKLISSTKGKTSCNADQTRKSASERPTERGVYFSRKGLRGGQERRTLLEGGLGKDYGKEETPI